MLEDVPVHGSRTDSRSAKQIAHQRNFSLDFRHVTGANGPPAGCGHQRNRSLDSVLQRIPEDMTPTSPEGAPLRMPLEVSSPRLALPPEVPTGSDDSGIHTPPDGNDEDRPQPPAAARSRESLDSGNPEDTDKPPDPPDTLVNTTTTLKTNSSAAESSKNKDFLLRLFESKLFDMSMAISYLFNSKEPGVQTYLANKLFSFPFEDVDFYLPQLATMYIEMGDVADVLKPYLVYRCKQSAEFSLRLAWLLTAFGGDAKRSKATKLKDSILAEEIRPAARRGHQRTQSDASALRLATPTGRHLGDLASGRAFDNGCLCGEQCSCGAPRLAPQTQFLNALTNIGRRLASVADKERRNGRLRAELAALDLNLPAKVWLPLHQKPHYVLRIPPHAAAVLNSKDKAPYIMYVEVLETEGHEPLPPRLLPPAPPAPHSPPIRHTKSEENLVPEWPALSLYTGLDDVDTGDCWSHDDDEVTPQCLFVDRAPAPDSLSQVSAISALSTSSCGSRESVAVGAGEVRRRLADATQAPPPNAFKHDPADPSATALKESWESKLARMRSTSPYGSNSGWRLLGCIVKVGDDLRQEMLAAQLLRRLQALWDLERVPLRLHPYEILCLDKESGLIQPVLNSVSLHQIKKQSGKSLRAWLELEHGPSTSEQFMRAQRNFVESAAAYAITSYLLQLKDRHNGNILLDSAGHIIHIDFGFIFSISPKNLGFESSPFKLTQEFVEVMDGENSDMFRYFKILIFRGLIAARKHCDQIIHVVELMRMGGQLSCLRSSSAVSSFRGRFHHGKTEPELQALVERLVRDALHSISTRLYDNYQYYTNGIL